MRFWRKQLAGLVTLELPTDHARPAQLNNRGDIERFELPAALVVWLNALARKHNVTLYMVLLAAFQVLLMRYSGQEDIAVGTPVAGRNRPEMEGLIGFFVNTLVMRGDLSGNPRFSELLERTRCYALDAYTHQHLPFEKLVEELKPERDMSRNPLFQVMFTLKNAAEGELHLAGLRCERLPLHYCTAKLDLSLSLTETQGELLGILEYSTDLFDASRIHRMAGHYRTLLESLNLAPDTPIWQLPLLTVRERNQLLVEWNDTATDYHRDRCVHELFEAQAARTPDAIAVVFGDQQLTYRELNARANQLAHYLCNLDVGPEVLVGLCVERSTNMVVGMLAILKAGGAYVPLNPDYPQNRLNFMLRDTRAAVVLTQSGLKGRLPDGAANLLSLDTDSALWSAQRDTNPAAFATPGGLAYVIYTSGSTGMPKGVCITHRGLGNYLNWAIHAYKVGDGIGAPVQSSVAFDLTVTSLFAPLLVGRRADLLPEDQGVEALAGALQTTSRYSLVKLTPAHLQLLEQQLPAWHVAGRAQTFVIGGEQLLAQALEFWRQQAPDTVLVNEYGPTETVVGCCAYTVTPKTRRNGAIPIGRPIANTQMYILDRYMEPVPIGVVGEIYVGGDGVAREYWNRPQLTMERFVTNPFRKQPNARLYRTGDLARYLPDGCIEFLGRIDHQIKLHGFRIEPGEIEAVLQEDDAILQSLVMVREDRSGDKRLVAYVVGQGIDAEAQRARLKGQLPDYMIPGAFVVLDSLPLTPNGKVDRKALPVPQQDLGALRYEAPRTPLEATIAEIWAETLKLPQVGIHDNFFDLGGHSLLAVQLMERLHQALGRRLHLNTLWYDASSVAQQARLLTEAGGGVRSTSPVVVMRMGGNAPALFCLHTIGGSNLFHYESFVRHLKGDRPVYGLQCRGIDGNRANDTSIEAMADYCIQSMRTIQPSGPYFLCGFSSGGLVAYEMARCLLQEGVEAKLFLLDSFLPNHAGSFSSHWRRWSRLIKQKRIREMQERIYHTALSHLGLSSLRSLRSVGESHRWAMWSYRPQSCALSAHYFEASEQSGGLPRGSIGWFPLLKGGLTLHLIPGTHGTMVKNDNAVILADKLSACLTQ